MTQRQFFRQDADVGGALHEDMVRRQQGVVLVDARPQVVEELLAALHPAFGQVVVDPANGDVAVSQAGAADLLKQVENHLALAEGIQEWAERAEVKSVGAHADEVAGDAIHFSDDDADDTGLFRDFLRVIAELLDRQRVSEIHVHPRQIIHAIGVGDELDGSDVLADLLGAAVQITEVGGHLGNDLAVGPQHQAQNAVRAGVLRTHIDQHLVGADIELDDGLVLLLIGEGGGGHVSPVATPVDRYSRLCGFASTPASRSAMSRFRFSLHYNWPIDRRTLFRSFAFFEHSDNGPVSYLRVRVMAHVIAFLHPPRRCIGLVARRGASGTTIMLRILGIVVPVKTARR